MAFPSQFLDLQNNVLAKGRLNSADDLQRVKDWINASYYTTCVQTKFYESSSVSSALTSGQTSVSVPASLVEIEWVVPTGSDGAVWGPMELVSMEDLLENRAWAAGTPTYGAPTRYAWRNAAAPTIEFWPNAAGGETLTFYGSQLPTALSANSDTPIFPEPYATKVLEYGALFEAAQFKKDLFFIGQYQGWYQEWTGRLTAFVNSRIGDKTQSFKVEKMRPYPRGNSVDTPWNS